MRFKHVCLEAFGYALPEEVMSSAEIERRLAPVYERFHLHEGRLELMSGIRERRLWERGVMPSDASTRAGRKALNTAGVDGSAIQCLIHGAVSRDCLEPATASMVHHHLHLADDALVYDISNACLGFLNGMISLGNMIDQGHIQRGMVVAGECSRQLLDSTIDSLIRKPDLTKAELKRAFASLTIGSGAVALILAHESVAKSRHRLLGGWSRSATAHHGLCQGSENAGFGAEAEMLMSTDAETLLIHGCELAAETWERFKPELGWTNDDVDRSFTHQVGSAHRERLYEMLQLDPSKDFSTLEFLGNVGSVSLPITMAIGIEQQEPAPGDNIAMLGIGSGLNCVMLGVQW